MIVAMVSMNLWAQGLVVGYVGCGVAVGLMLRGRGHTQKVAVTAALAWPVMLPLLSTQGGAGPMRGEIVHGLDTFRRAIRSPELAAADLAGELDSLGVALFDADRRLGAVDQLLAEAPGESETKRQLVLARGRCVRQIQRVLEDLAELRLQAGLQALSGGADALRERLVELSARATAQSEIDGLGRPAPVDESLP